MTRIGLRQIILISAVVFIASACAQPPVQTTQVAIQMLDLSNVHIDLNQTNPTTTPTDTLPPTSTDTPAPTETMPAAAAEADTTATATSPASPTPSCTNIAEFVKHLNVSDNTAFKPDTLFAKVWLIKNAGTCTWTTGYKLVYINGDLMGAQTEIPLPYEVPPGSTVDLRVNLYAPTQPSTYINEWLFRDPDGNQFGIGASADEPLRVQIVVVPVWEPVRL